MSGVPLFIITVLVFVAFIAATAIDVCIARAIPMRACALITTDLILNNGANSHAYQDAVEHYRP